MVRTALFLGLLVAEVAHAASLTARVDKTTTALGEAVTLTVEARGADLDALEFGALGEHFELNGQTLSRGSDGATLVLTLYPRAVGMLRIPTLAAAGRRTPPLDIIVTDGSEQVPRVSIAWSLEPAAPFVNQPARLSLAICDDGSLQWQRPALPSVTGRVLRALGEEEDASERDGAPCTLHRFHWALLASRDGAAELRADMLDSRRFGERLRFPAPAFAYRAQALPAWLPAQVPPVAPTVSAGPLPLRGSLNQPLAWRVEISGGYSADGLKALIDLQLRETPALAVYPPSIEALAPDDRNSPLTRHAVTLFLQPRATGPLELPALRLPWYDPVHGRLAEVTLAGPTLDIVDPRWRRAGEAAGGLASAVLLALAGAQARRMLTWRMARRRGLARIRGAQDADSLAHAVRAFSLAGAAPAPSLGEWVERLQAETGADPVKPVRQLERHCFGRAQSDWKTAQQAILNLLARVRPRRG